MWNKGFCSDNNKPEEFSLIGTSLGSAASVSQTSDGQDGLVEKMLAAASVGKRKHGLVLKKKLRECMPVEEPGWLL